MIFMLILNKISIKTHNFIKVFKITLFLCLFLKYIEKFDVIYKLSIKFDY